MLRVWNTNQKNPAKNQPMIESVKKIGHVKIYLDYGFNEFIFCNEYYI